MIKLLKTKELMGLKLFGTGLEMPILMIGPKILPFLAVFLFSPFWAQHALADLDDEVSDPVSRDGTSTAPAPSRGDGRGARPYSETGPRELQAYLREGITPNYIRIDVRGYNIRRSPDFSTDRSSNIDFKTKGGELFAVESVKRLQYGAAVQVHVDGELRWVYVPYGRKNDFQFCESEACFTAMARSLDFLLRGTGVSVDQAQNCGVSSGPEGLILPAGASVPRTEPDRVTLTRVAAEPSRSATSSPRRSAASRATAASSASSRDRPWPPARRNR